MSKARLPLLHMPLWHAHDKLCKYVGTIYKYEQKMTAKRQWG